MSGEKARAERLRRLVDVQERKRQLEEWRLAEIKRDGITLANHSVEIIESLGNESLLQGLFLEAKASALRRNEVLIARNLDAQRLAERKLMEAQGMEKRLEKASGEARSAADRVLERESLSLALDDYLTATDASFE